MAELDDLIGLSGVKQEVRTLANFLKVQVERTKAGLPAAALSLHMVFGGNPGTGKTSVARIVGKIFGAMGVLPRGHLIETDRSGLVAEYAGQTGPKTHKKIEEALDGVLFIDEAYTLIHAEGDDPYGHEAVQTLLKRMEDDRDRLVVILAGYPA
jgi:SpoVK/Ycf46/Vps4 family AAA+-type ATPase